MKNISPKHIFILGLLGVTRGRATPEIPLESLAVVTPSISSGPNQFKSTLKPGRYIGMDYMGTLDITPDDPTDKWYHENTLTVRGDSLYLEEVPVVINKGQPKAYSSSDGGFYSYRGKLYYQGNQLIAKMLLVSHDYVLTPFIVPPDKLAQARLDISYEEKVKRGIYLVDSTFYKREFAIIPQAEGFLMDSVLYQRNK